MSFGGQFGPVLRCTMGGRAAKIRYFFAPGSFLPFSVLGWSLGMLLRAIWKHFRVPCFLLLRLVARAFAFVAVATVLTRTERAQN